MLRPTRQESRISLALVALGPLAVIQLPLFAASGAHQTPPPIEGRRVGAVPLGEPGRVGLELLPAVPARGE